MIPADVVRLPAPTDPTADSYKDWLHLNVFGPRDCIGLVNVSVHGRPADPSCQVVTTALLHTGDAWHGNVVTGSWAQAAVGLDRIGTPAGSVALEPGGRVIAGASVDDLALHLVAAPVVPAYPAVEPQPFGTGWIGWRVLPRLSAEGPIRIGDHALSGGTRLAYHDHNWGRWHWGDDIGWDWGSFLHGAGDGSVVFARTTDRAHLRCGSPTVLLDRAGARRTFTGDRVRVEWSGQAAPPARRLPGAMAALHGDHRRPRIPAVLRLSARSGRDGLELEFTARSVAQLILADPVTAGFSFLHEIGGHFEAAGRLAGGSWDMAGPAVVERLE